MKRIPSLLAPVLAAAVLLPILDAASAADKVRGRTLYEARCVGCHSTSVHRRESRKAKTFDEIRVQTAKWDRATGGVWGKDEVDDVAFYLNDVYYRLPCPTTVCVEDKAERAAPPAPKKKDPA
jgi:hypothetical protein